MLTETEKLRRHQELPPPDPVPKNHNRDKASEIHRIKDGEDWYRVAEIYDVDVMELIAFNFDTTVPEYVNWYLRSYVGCDKSDDGGNNWAFSSSAESNSDITSPRKGLIFIPPFIFEDDVITVRPAHDDEDRFNRLVGRMLAETRAHGGPKSMSVRDRKQLTCLLRKLKDKRADHEFIYAHKTEWNAHSYVWGGKGKGIKNTYENGKSPEDIAWNARKVIEHWINWRRYINYNDLYEDFRIEVATLYDDINVGLLKIKQLQNGKIIHPHFSRSGARALFSWAKKKQEKHSSVLKCFTKS